MKSKVNCSSGLTMVAWNAVSATGSREGMRMDWSRRQETLLAVYRASRARSSYVKDATERGSSGPVGPVAIQW
jgi:hypothetical protein